MAVPVFCLPRPLSRRLRGQVCGGSSLIGRREEEKQIMAASPGPLRKHAFLLAFWSLLGGEVQSWWQERGEETVARDIPPLSPSALQLGAPWGWEGSVFESSLACHQPLRGSPWVWEGPPLGRAHRHGETWLCTFLWSEMQAQCSVLPHTRHSTCSSGCALCATFLT